MYDPHDVFATRLNTEMVQLQQLDEEEPSCAIDRARSFRAQDSALAAELIEDWESKVTNFKKVMPVDYARVLDVMKQADAEGLDEQQTLDRVMEAARG